MYGPAGHAYVYLIYGIYHCFNVVTQKRNVPHAVLIRALEPVSGIDESPSGPGRLCRALEIDRKFDGCDLRGDALFIVRPTKKLWSEPRLGVSPRIGIDYAGGWVEKPWRFFDDNSKSVSKRPAARRKG